MCKQLASRHQSTMELLTIDQAARACGVSRDTIKRRLYAGAFPGAERGTPHGRREPPWRIPMSDLAAAGLCPAKTAADVEGHPVGQSTELIRALEAHLHDLRAQNRRLLQTVDALVGALATTSSTCDCTSQAPLDLPNGPAKYAGIVSKETTK